MPHYLLPDQISKLREAIERGKVSGITKKEIANSIYFISRKQLNRRLKRLYPELNKDGDWIKDLSGKEFEEVLSRLGNPIETYEKKN